MNGSDFFHIFKIHTSHDTLENLKSYIKAFQLETCTLLSLLRIIEITD